MPICQPKSVAAEVDVGVAVKTAMPPPLAALQVTWLPSGATVMAFTVTSTVSLAVPQLGLLWLVTVIFKVAVPTLDRVTVGSSAVASEKLTTRSEGLLESTVRIEDSLVFCRPAIRLVTTGRARSMMVSRGRRRDHSPLGRSKGRRHSHWKSVRRLGGRTL